MTSTTNEQVTTAAATTGPTGARRVSLRARRRSQEHHAAHRRCRRGRRLPTGAELAAPAFRLPTATGIVSRVAVPSSPQSLSAVVVRTFFHVSPSSVVIFASLITTSCFISPRYLCKYVADTLLTNYRQTRIIRIIRKPT